jgi:hypothetical protein
MRGRAALVLLLLVLSSLTLLGTASPARAYTCVATPEECEDTFNDFYEEDPWWHIELPEDRGYLYAASISVFAIVGGIVALRMVRPKADERSP